MRRANRVDGLLRGVAVLFLSFLIEGVDPFANVNRFVLVLADKESDRLAAALHSAGSVDTRSHIENEV